MELKNNKKGIALASVIILIALISLLASTIVRLSYLAYTRKAVEKKNNENFYCAEAVIDNVKTILQNAAAVAIPQAQYSEEDFAKYAFCVITGRPTTQASLDGLTVGDHVTNTSVQDFLFQKLIKDASGNDKYDTNYYLNGESTKIKNAITSVAAGGNGGSFSIGEIVLESSGVRIKDVSVTYVNDEGFTASIKTDIVINSPKYIKASDAPLGSYSMFAGSGAMIYSCGGSTPSAINNVLYLHQEGNGYFGAMSGNASRNALIIGGDASNNLGGCGCSILSFDGTNIVMNGDVRIKNGGSLIFTGGDGTQSAQVQVNGYIVLEDGASLFIAPNVKINCMGVVSSLSYSPATGGATPKSAKKGTGNTIEWYDGAPTESGGVTGNKICTLTYTPYDGTSSEEWTSQLYPVTTDYIHGKNATLLSNYYDNKIDAQQLFYKTGTVGTSGANDSDLDTRYKNVAGGGTSRGVYVLSGTTTNAGWNNRSGWIYQRLDLSVSGTSWTWKNAVTTHSSSLIYCNPLDMKLAQTGKTVYNGVSYDSEYFRIVNAPLIKLAAGNDKSTTVGFQNYSIEEPTKYTKKTWADVKSNAAINGKISSGNWTTLTGLGFLTREFYIPKAIALGNMDYSSYTVPTSIDNTTFSTKGSDVIINYGSVGAINTSNGGIYFLNSFEDLVLHACSGYITGIFLSSEKVKWSDSASSCRVISLLDLSKRVTGAAAGTKITEPANPVHKLLAYIGTGYITREGSWSNPSEPFYGNQEFALMDNMFNGGIKIFWLMGESNGGGAADNSDNDLIDVDKWNKQ